ncbi:hypothetical protein BIW11_11033 [Tropilaelaps mercedesae]|uniref:Lipocalin/cytosolic fatty-acid binding domain-containing protein n=1 Tax=Tropilaelaps mercedesae TaxID=418985 RepID=A0A1V9XD81_9ACAR|nr:hypothetical protein BIW11_11033 [Tropilaelaps mercedesae]
MDLLRMHLVFWTTALFITNYYLTSAEKRILMKNFDPEKIQGKWYLQRLNMILVSDVHPELECIEFTLNHDPLIEDLYNLSSHWFNNNHEYQETHFNILDDRTEKARYFFQSHKDKVAVSILGTDYDNWMLGFGANLGKDSYYIASRAKSFPKQYMPAIDELLALNEVTRNWIEVKNDGECPEGH